MDNENESDRIPKKSYFHYVDEKYPVSTQSLPEVYEEAANRQPQNYVTFHRPAERYTYRELYQRAQKVAKGLLAVGLKRGDCIMGVGCQGSDGVVMFMAATSIGLIFTCPYLYSPMHKTLVAALNCIEPRLILAGDCHAGMLGERTFITLTDVLKEYQAKSHFPLVYYDSITAEYEECMKYNRHGKSLNLLVLEGEAISDAMLNEETSLTGSTEACFYTQSSGSTGEPKNVVLGAAYFTNSVYTLTAYRGYTIDNAVMGTMNLATEDVGLASDFITAASIGCPLIIFPKPVTYDEDCVVQEMLECIEKHRPTYLDLDQYFTRLIVRDMTLRDQYDLSSVKGWTIYGSPIENSTRQQILNSYPDTVNIFGLSEVLWLCIPFHEMNQTKIESVGRPIPNVQAKICDENGNEVSVKENGELLVKAPNLFLYYRNLPELTAKMFTPDGWFKTGDCMWMDEDGDLFFVGRMSKYERYKVCSDVVYSTPIETILKRHSKIRECCVIGIAVVNEDSDQLCYCIVPNVVNSLTRQEISDFAIENMRNQNQWPRRILILEAIPRQGARQKYNRVKLIETIQKEVRMDDSLYQVEYTFTGNKM